MVYFSHVQEPRKHWSHCWQPDGLGHWGDSQRQHHGGETYGTSHFGNGQKGVVVSRAAEGLPSRWPCAVSANVELTNRSCQQGVLQLRALWSRFYEACMDLQQQLVLMSQKHHPKITSVVSLKITTKKETWTQNCHGFESSLRSFQTIITTSNQGETWASEFNNFANRALRPSNPNMVTHYVDGAGRNRIKGGSSLKQSQSYPRQCIGLILMFTILLLFLFVASTPQNSTSFIGSWLLSSPGSDEL